jgi:hypothetical protein
VTLPADEGTHFLARGVAVDIVVRHALTGLECLNSFQETGARDTQLQGLGS